MTANHHNHHNHHNHRNWTKIGTGCYVNDLDERYVVRLLERAITPVNAGRQWTVLLYREDLLREHIATTSTCERALDAMTSWLKEYATILGPPTLDDDGTDDGDDIR